MFIISSHRDDKEPASFSALVSSLFFLSSSPKSSNGFLSSIFEYLLVPIVVFTYGSVRKRSTSSLTRPISPSAVFILVPGGIFSLII